MRYKRFLVAFILLLISVSTSLFAYYIEDNLQAQNNVDLSNDLVTNYSCLENHNISSDSEEIMLDYNSAKVIARIILDKELESGGTISFDFNDLNYKYTDANGRSSKRPYGIELVFKQEWTIEGKPREEAVGGYIAIGSGHNGIAFQNGNTAEFVIPAGEDTSAIVDTILESTILRIIFYIRYLIYLINPSHWDTTFEEYVNMLITQNSTRLESGYIDVVLVLPELTFEQENQMVYSDEYSASFTVNGTETVPFTGYYRKNNNPLTFNLTVDGNENTKLIDLSSDVIRSSNENGLVIGSYEYSAEFINDSINVPNLRYYSFVSSSANPEVPTGEFVLVDTIDKQNTIKYQIGLKNESNPIKWYTGDMSVVLGENASNEFGGLLAGPSSYKVVDNITVLEDTGVILFKLTEASDDPFEIPPGTYSSNIYFHVIANV